MVVSFGFSHGWMYVIKAAQEIYWESAQLHSAPPQQVSSSLQKYPCPFRKSSYLYSVPFTKQSLVLSSIQKAVISIQKSSFVFSSIQKAVTCIQFHSRVFICTHFHSKSGYLYSVPFKSLHLYSVPLKSLHLNSVPFKKHSVPFRKRSLVFQSLHLYSVPFKKRSLVFQSLHLHSVPFTMSSFVFSSIQTAVTCIQRYTKCIEGVQKAFRSNLPHPKEVLWVWIEPRITWFWCFLGVRELVDTYFHASCAAWHNKTKQPAFPTTWRRTVSRSEQVNEQFIVLASVV